MRYFEESIELTSACTVSLYVLDCNTNQYKDLVAILEHLWLPTSAYTVSLYLLDCNAPAIKFYTKQGVIFGNVQLLDNYQGQTIIDVQMIKNLIKSSQ